MEIDPLKYRKQMLKLRKELLLAEKDRAQGKIGYSIDEIVEKMKKAVEEVTDNN